MTDKIRVDVLPIAEAATPDPHNANRHTQRGGGMLENSLRKRGAFRSIASAGKGAEVPVVYAGNYTLEKAVTAGFTEIVNVHVTGNQLVNVVRDDIEPFSAEAVALGLEDNEIGHLSYSPDIDIIAALTVGDGALLAALQKSDDVLRGMLEGMGIKNGEPGDAEPQIDRAEILLEKWGVVRGDLWAIGSHKLLCGDSTVRVDVDRVMGGEKAQAVVTDPPYGIDLNTDLSEIKTDWKGWKGQGGKYDAVIGDDKPYDPSHIFEFFNCDEVFLWGADYYAERIPNKNMGSWIVWDKRSNEKTGARLTWGLGSEFELCWSKKQHKREIIRKLWSGLYGTETQDVRNRVHPTQKPVEVIAWVIEKYTNESDVVVDLFAGSGTTMVACNNLKRKCFAIEIDPAYCAVILQRMTDLGLSPILVKEPAGENVAPDMALSAQGN